MDELISLTGNVKESHVTIQLPLVNLLRLTTVYMRKYLEEYRQGHKTNEITEFYKWVRKEKLKIDEAQGESVLL